MMQNCLKTVETAEKFFPFRWSELLTLVFAGKLKIILFQSMGFLKIINQVNNFSKKIILLFLLALRSPFLKFFLFLKIVIYFD